MSIIRLKIYLFTLCLAISSVKAEEICGRTAMIDKQNVLVDFSTSQKGEGLRPYLEKDSVALNYLNKYQSGHEFEWGDAALGTTGGLLILGGLFLNLSEKDNSAFIITGVSLMALNLLLGYSKKNANEKNLQRAIEEYNKRNRPKILAPPLSYVFPQEKKIGIFKQWEF